MQSTQSVCQLYDMFYGPIVCVSHTTHTTHTKRSFVKGIALLYPKGMQSFALHVKGIAKLCKGLCSGEISLKKDKRFLDMPQLL